MEDIALEKYLLHIEDAFENKQLIKISVSKKQIKTADLKLVSAKLAEIKKELQLSFTFRYATQDMTKNFDLSQSKENIKSLLSDQFLQSELYTTENIIHYLKNKKGHSRLIIKKNHNDNSVNLNHDRQKNRILDPSSLYFKSLGISNSKGIIKKDGQAKFKQINKFIETIKSLDIKQASDRKFTIYDMGSGKGYLSFALYDYLNNILKLDTQLTGIELREELVEKCNQISKESKFLNLNFQSGYIENTVITQADMLIALHACDTATDEAIAKGISSKARYIICSPCCHKQLRPQVNPDNALKNITQYGILKERQSEMITDTIRALILESFGYKTKIMEYVSTEHTPKNLLIVAYKNEESNERRVEFLEQINGLKNLFGIQTHYLEKLTENL